MTTQHKSNKMNNWELKRRRQNTWCVYLFITDTEIVSVVINTAVCKSKHMMTSQSIQNAFSSDLHQSLHDILYQHRSSIVVVADLWSPYVIGQTTYIFIMSFVLLLLPFFSSPNLSGRRLDVCHTSTHGVALVRI